MRLLAVLAMAVAGYSQTPAPVLTLTVLEGEGAINNIRQRTAREPIVQVEDENHRPVAGVAVVFTLPTTGASGTFTNGSNTLTVLTDDQGRAVARGLRPNNVQGQYQIRVNASKNGQTASITIAQTNALLGAAAGAAAGGISGKLIAIIAVAAGAAVAGGVVAATHNGNNNTTGTITPGAGLVTITPGTGAVGPPR